MVEGQPLGSGGWWRGIERRQRGWYRQGLPASNRRGFGADLE